MKADSDRPESTDFEIEVKDIGHDDACVYFFPPFTLERRFIEYFELHLYEEGSTRTFKEMQ
jgi:hypothetical protein